MRAFIFLLTCSLVACGSASRSQVRSAEESNPLDARCRGQCEDPAPPLAVGGRRSANSEVGLAENSARKNEIVARTSEEASLRSDVVAIAAQYVGLSSLRGVTREFPDDCTGFVRLVFDQVGVDLMGHGAPKDNGVTAIWRGAKSKGALVKRTLRPGDIVFFQETYDRNRDGRRNDGLTHLGIVEEVLEDGTVVFIHRGGKGIARSRFHPSAPAVRYANDGRLLNDYLRARSRKLRAYLAGELWAGAASVDRFR